MKKLFIGLLLGCLFISCGVKDNRSEWDKDDIAYTNNSEYVPYEKTNDSGTYLSTGFKRLSGSNGIIGSYERITLDSSGKVYQDLESYSFSSDGKYLYKYYCQSGSSVLNNINSNGAFKLYKYSDKYYIFELENRSEAKFYQVSDKGINVFSSYEDESGEKHYAGVELKYLK